MKKYDFSVGSDGSSTSICYFIVITVVVKVLVVVLIIVNVI